MVVFGPSSGQYLTPDISVCQISLFLTPPLTSAGHANAICESYSCTPKMSKAAHAAVSFQSQWP